VHFFHLNININIKISGLESNMPLIDISSN